MATGLPSPLDPPKRLWPAVAWKASTATIPVAVTAMLAALSRARRGRRATSRSPSSSGTGSRAEIAISRGPAPRRAGRIGQRADRAGAGGADRGHQRRGQRHRQRHGHHQPGDGQGERRRAGGADQGGAGTGDQRGGQPSDGQPGRRRDQRQDQVLGQQHHGDQPRRAADRLEQSDPPGPLRHPAAGQHRHGGQGQQPGQPGTGRQDLLLVLHQQAVRGGDPLPRGQRRARPGCCCAAVPAWRTPAPWPGR